MSSSLPKSHQLIPGENITAYFYFQTKSLHLLILEQHIYPYTSLFSENIFIPWQRPYLFLFLWQRPSISILKQYPSIFLSFFFGHWFCISLFSNKNNEYFSNKILGYFYWIFCIIRQYNCKPFVGQHPCIVLFFFGNNFLVFIMLGQYHVYIFLSFDIIPAYFLFFDNILANLISWDNISAYFINWKL